MEDIDKILKEKLQTIMENIDINEEVDTYSDVYLDDDYEEDLIDSDDFMEQLNQFIENDEDEIEICYDTDESIVLEKSVVEKLLEKYSEQELIEGANDISKLQGMILSMYEDVYEYDEEDEE